MEASSFFLTGNHPVRVVSRHHFGRPLMKKAITLFIEGFIEGWNGSSVKPAGNPQPPKATATGFDVGIHLTRPLQNSPKSPKFLLRHLGDFP